MLIRRPDDIASSEITPESTYVGRRQFVGTTGALALAALVVPTALSQVAVTPETDTI